MKCYDLITPEGTKDFLFEDCLIRQRIELQLHDIFKKRDYSRVVTPGLEFFDVFSLNSVFFPQESLYKLTDNKGRLMVVRPDNTMPIARLVATRLREARLPLRLYYNQSVYTAVRSMSGQSDETVQTGIELIGSQSRRADLEVLTTAIEAMSCCCKACNSDDFRFEIGDSGFFCELVHQLPATDDVREEVRRLVEMKNYPALNDLLDSITDSKVATALKQLPRLFGGEEVFERAASLFTDEKIEGILANLKSVYRELGRLALGGQITVDLGIVNRADYYTGIVMKGYLQGYGEEILSGGRYDKLLSEFGYDLPATGFAVNVDAVSALIKQSENHPTLAPPSAIVYGEEGFEMDALIFANTLRAEKKVVENAVFDNFFEVENYAKLKGIVSIITVGKDGVKEVLA